MAKIINIQEHLHPNKLRRPQFSYGYGNVINLIAWKSRENTKALIMLCEDTTDMLDEATELLRHYPHRKDEIEKRIEGWCCYWDADYREKRIRLSKQKENSNGRGANIKKQGSWLAWTASLSNGMGE